MKSVFVHLIFILSLITRKLSAYGVVSTICDYISTNRSPLRGLLFNIPTFQHSNIQLSSPQANLLGNFPLLSGRPYGAKLSNYGAKLSNFISRWTEMFFTQPFPNGILGSAGFKTSTGKPDGRFGDYRGKRVARHILSACLLQTGRSDGAKLFKLYPPLADNFINFLLLLLLLTTYQLPLTTCLLRADGFDVIPRNISDSETSGGLYFETISYTDTCTDTFKLAEQYLEVNSSSSIWKIDIYTNNTTSYAPAYLGSQRGGLLDTTSKTFRLPLGWQVSPSTAPPMVGNPNNSGWVWLKDKGDEDDTGTANDESWDAAQQSGYTTIVCNTTAEAVHFYIEAICNGLAAGDYSGTIWFDLYHGDISPPVISYVPIEEINMLWNEIDISSVNVIDDKQVVFAKLHYKVNDGSWQEKLMTLDGELSYNKQCYAVIGSTEVTKAGKVYYAIESSDGQNPTWWDNRNTDNPREIKISRKTFRNMRSGKLEVSDGNPKDGSTSLDIPEDALAKNVDITITQWDTDDPSIPDGNGACASKRPVAVYEFQQNGLTFKKPVSLSLLYFDLDNDGKAETMRAIKTDIDETKLGIFWWDGFDWRLVGGKVDTVLNTVTAKITHFSLYAVFPVGPLTADDYRPNEKIITPASIDTHNDYATFNGFDGFSEFEINIYDITGRKVITINQDSASGPRWDGIDELGNIVESGVYIYQFKAKIDGKMKYVSGTVVVAK
ncbi:MAG: gliding motility-associated C-terminal domain-containing protein [Elusimicrobiota bacterium]